MDVLCTVAAEKVLEPLPGQRRLATTSLLFQLKMRQELYKSGELRAGASLRTVKILSVVQF